MKNISFDNPYLLLVLIPLLICIIVPILIAIRKENKTKAIMASLVIHIVLAICITLALGGMIYTSVMTETQVVVLADVSYSADRNLDEIDEYIRQIEDNLPRNAKMSVVVFARDYKVLTEMGDQLTSVKNHGFTPLQVAATDISTALNHAVTLFDENVIKRIVMITDGKQTKTDSNGELVAAVENAYAKNIYIDAIFVDSNVNDGVKEVQISDAEFSASTYVGHDSSVKVLIQSTFETDNAALDLVRVSGVGEETVTIPISLSKGYNTIKLDLDTSGAGSKNYRLIVRADGDTSSRNNTYSFSQTVTEKKQVLLVTWDEADLRRLEQFYDENTVIDAYIKQKDVPCTIEELCKYDEIVLSNFDVRELNNYTAFVDGVDKAVSRFGKSLITMGNLQIQGRNDTVLKQLEDMLPVKYGNNEQDPKLFTIVLDASRSMQNFSRLRIAKQAAGYLLNMLSDNDYVMVVAFWGDCSVIVPATSAVNRDEVADIINAWEPQQGTMLGTALDKAGELMKQLPYEHKQIMLISDGMSYSMEEDTPEQVVADLYANNITTSVIHPAGRLDDEGGESANGNPLGLKRIASAGGGNYYAVTRESDLAEIMFGQIGPDVTESIIEGRYTVSIKNRTSAVMAGIDALPDIMGYTFAKTKASASTILTVNYKRASNTVVEVPLFAYWDYGNGRVSSFTSTMTGQWSQYWDSEEGTRFFTNVMTESIPDERVDTPYDVNVEFDGVNSFVEIIPATLRTDAKTEVTLIDASGNEVTETLVFDSTRYFYEFETPKTGRYIIRVTYSYEDKVFTSESMFNISYYPEYNAFENFDPSSLHAAIRNRGTVCEGTIPNLENDEKEVSTYTVRFLAPLMILSVVLYVVDIAIRKLKISDIKSFFKIKSRKGAGQ